MKQPEQLAKKYFPEFPQRMRKHLVSQLSHLHKHDLENEFKTLRNKIDTDKAEAIPVLLHSIAANSLGYEYNEQIKDTCYMDYSNKNISRHAKGFIAGQYKIFRNEHESLIKDQSENIGAIINRLDSAITLMIKLGVLGLIDFEDHLKAIELDPKSVNGIVKKVLKNAK